MTNNTNIRSHPRSKMAQFLDKRIDELEGTITLVEIAHKMGYPRGHIISMFRADQAKVPLDKIPALAEVLQVDVAHLMRLGLEQYWPEPIDAITKMFSRIVTDNEFELIQEIRERTSDLDPKLYSARSATSTGVWVMKRKRSKTKQGSRRHGKAAATPLRDQAHAADFPDRGSHGGCCDRRARRTACIP